MSDRFPTDAPRSRARTSARGRAGVIAALALLAFAGLILAAYAVRHARLHDAPAAAAPDAPVKTAAAPPAVVPEQTPLAAAIDPATLAIREATLAGQVAALEARTATITADAAAAGGQAGRAEALLVAFASRRALDRGEGLGYLEPQLRDRFAAAQPRAVAIVLQAGRQPVTLEDLRQGLDAIAPDLVSAAGQGWFASLRAQLGNLVVLRRVGTPSPIPVDRLARATRLLDGGQVEAARAEVARLPGAATAGNWLAAAHRYVLARQALDVLENTALAGRAAPIR